MSQKKVPPKLRDVVIQLSAEGLVSDAIAEKLNAEHGLEISGRGIRRLLQEHRDELADVAKGVARDELRKHLLNCVKVIVGVAVRAHTVETVARAGTPGPKELSVALQAQDRQMRAAAMLLHFAGLNQPDHPDEQPENRLPQKDALMQRLERLINAETEPAPGPKDEPPVH